ncbi:MAG: ABC transporter ATP-binding protein [Oscillospiraceae bacterium]|nr:ABC transporter ATP-binding protein [Oscillospiraceae bacterium]
MKLKTLKRLLSYVKPYTPLVVIAFILAAVAVALTLTAPIITGKAVDCIIGKGNVDFELMMKYIIILFFVVIGTALSNWLLGFVMNKISHGTVRDIRNETFSKFSKLPLSYIDHTPKGDTMSVIISDVDSISDGIIQGFTQLFTGIATIVGTLIFMFGINVKIALVCVLITPLSLVVASTISKYSYKFFSEQTEVRGELGGYINEMISGQKTIQAFSYKESSEKKFKEINGRLYKCGVKAQFLSALTNPCTRFVNGIVYAAVGVSGAFAVVGGALSVGFLSTFLAYANQYTKPFNEISGVITELQAALSGAERVFALLDEKEEESDENMPTLENPDGSVSVENVFFSYDKNVPLIEDFNLKVNPGMRVAIVGPTGCGKTTLINLLMRFYDVNSGKISVSGNDITEITRDSLRSNYGMVLQETWLFKGTIRDNIAYGADNPTDEEIVEAAKSAYAHSFIKRLPDGYDTVISDDDENISQGQKQLLCIARVMLIKPKMLILDEATSSIDTMTEIRVQKAFNKIMEGRTSFVIAHRLSTIKEADAILVMKSGKVIEIGTHDELIKKAGFYSELYNSQYRQA